MKVKWLISLFIIFLQSYGCVQAQNCSSDKQVLQTIKDFYTSYVTAVSAGADEKELTSIQKKYCTVSFLNKIKRQFEKQELDYDPFLKAQDSDTALLKTLLIKRYCKKSDTYIVLYIDSYSNTKISIKLSILKEKDNFKIASVW